MSADQALQLLSQLFWNSFLIAGPVLAATLAVGLLVSAFQVVTQLQEMSLGT
jgi:flagellar biosynthetic protein FliQ